MSHPIVRALTAAVLLATPALVMCSSAPEPTAQELAPQFDVSPEDTSQTFESASPWLADDASAVIVAAQPGMWDMARVAPLIMDESELEAGQPGTHEALRADITDAMVDALGFDPADVDAFAVGHSTDHLTGVLFGDLGVLDDLTAVEHGELNLYQFDGARVPHGVIAELYLLPIDRPRPGIAVADSPELLGQLAEGQNSLAASERGDSFEAFFAISDATFTAAARLDEAFGPGDEPLPDIAGFSVGDRLVFSARGDAALLDEIEAGVDEGRTELLSRTGRILDDPHTPLVERLLATVGHHFGTSFDERLHTERADDTLRYEFELLGVDEDSPYANPAIPTLATVVLLDELLRTSRTPSPQAPDPAAVEEYSLPSSE